MRYQVASKKNLAESRRGVLPAMAKAPSTSTDHPVLRLQRSLGNGSVSRLLVSRKARQACSCGGTCPRCSGEGPIVQTKLRISSPEDRSEREADRVAKQVMRAPRPTLIQPSGYARLQRVCQGCAEELGEEELIQSKSTGRSASEVGPALEAPIRGLRGRGQPLPPSVRGFFEPRFGYDFGGVRVHRDSQLARAVNARAFTVGQDIVFDSGQYAPGTMSGQSLLAHELAHTVQQSRPGSLQLQRLVRRTRVVNCGANNPFGADRRASRLLGRAVDRIHSAQAYRALLPNDADVQAVGRALRRAFRLNPNRDTTWTRWVPRIKARLSAAQSYLDSVVFRYECCTVGGACGATCGTCAAGDEAFMCAGDRSAITLCPLFWTRSRNQQGRILAHEVLHVTFGFIRDWAQPDLANAHCYAQFTALLNGFNSPAGFRCH